MSYRRLLLTARALQPAIPGSNPIPGSRLNARTPQALVHIVTISSLKNLPRAHKNGRLE